MTAKRFGFSTLAVLVCLGSWQGTSETGLPSTERSSSVSVADAAPGGLGETDNCQFVERNYDGELSGISYSPEEPDKVRGGWGKKCVNVGWA